MTEPTRIYHTFTPIKHEPHRHRVICHVRTLMRLNSYLILIHSIITLCEPRQTRQRSVKQREREKKAEFPTRLIHLCLPRQLGSMCEKPFLSAMHKKCISLWRLATADLYGRRRQHCDGVATNRDLKYPDGEKNDNWQVNVASQSNGMHNRCTGKWMGLTSNRRKCLKRNGFRAKSSNHVIDCAINQ